MDLTRILLFALGVLTFLVILLVSVGLHEGGHMLAAKKLGIKVPEFFVGFGQKVWSFKRKGTEYGFRWIPAGGYVRLVDENIEEGNPERELLSHVAPWKRQIIFVAGPLVNIILGLAILFATLLIYPYEQPIPAVKSTNVCSSSEVSCGARAVGIEPGDRVVSIDGSKIETSADLSPLLKGKDSVAIEVRRDGKLMDFPKVPVVDNRFGIYLQLEEIYRSPAEAAGLTGQLVMKSGEAVLQIPSKIPGLVATVFTGAERDPEAPGSVVGAGKSYGDVAATNKIDFGDKVRTFLLIAGGLNLSLGFLNLLPFPPLDGGRMLFAFIDSCRKWVAKLRNRSYSPTPYKWIRIATVVPAMVLFAVMALLVVADIVSPVNII